MDQYAVRAFEARALDYLCKPVHRARLRETIERLRTALPQRGLQDRAREAARDTGRLEPVERLLVESGGRIVLVPVVQIESIEAEGNYVRIHLPGKSYLHRRTLSSLEERLPARPFCRISRSAIVNLAMVREIARLARGDLLLTLHSGRALKLSRMYRARFDDATS